MDAKVSDGADDGDGNSCFGSVLVVVVVVVVVVVIVVGGDGCLNGEVLERIVPLPL